MAEYECALLLWSYRHKVQLTYAEERVVLDWPHPLEGRAYIELWCVDDVVTCAAGIELPDDGVLVSVQRYRPEELIRHLPSLKRTVDQLSLPDVRATTTRYVPVLELGSVSGFKRYSR
jgi:hypothetical protein